MADVCTQKKRIVAQEQFSHKFYMQHAIMWYSLDTTRSLIKYTITPPFDSVFIQGEEITLQRKRCMF